MANSQVFIPIVQATGNGTACATGEVTVVDGSCSAAASCSSGSSCSSGGGAAVDSNDPSVKRAQAGWSLRTTIGEPRLSEVVENYRAMGYEVHVEHFGTIRADEKHSGDAEPCTTCFDTADRSAPSQAWGSVYVRPGKAPDRNDDLF